MPEEPKNYELPPKIELQKASGDIKKSLELGKLEFRTSTFERMLKQIQEDFPKTNDLEKKEAEPFEAALRQCYAYDPENLAIINDGIDEAHKYGGGRNLSDFFEGKKRQAKSLYKLATEIKGAYLDEQDPINDIKKNLARKKILVLGDDIGSLSEILRFYGAESYGIEYKKFDVLVGHSGILTENGIPQNSLLEGNIADLFKDDTELFKQLQKLGSFDAIVSFSVFNDGSGVEEAITGAESSIGIGRPRITQQQAEIFQSNCSELLNDTGVQLHNDFNMWTAFPKNYFKALSPYYTGTAQEREFLYWPARNSPTIDCLKITKIKE